MATETRFGRDEPAPGTDVIVIDALGRYLEKRVARGAYPGGDFACIDVHWRDASPDTAVPWPAEDVWAPTAVEARPLSHDEYRAGRDALAATPEGEKA